MRERQHGHGGRSLVARLTSGLTQTRTACERPARFNPRSSRARCISGGIQAPDTIGQNKHQPVGTGRLGARPPADPNSFRASERDSESAVSKQALPRALVEGWPDEFRLRQIGQLRPERERAREIIMIIINIKTLRQLQHAVVVVVVVVVAQNNATAALVLAQFQRPVPMRNGLRKGARQLVSWP